MASTNIDLCDLTDQWDGKFAAIRSFPKSNISAERFIGLLTVSCFDIVLIHGKRNFFVLKLFLISRQLFETFSTFMYPNDMPYIYENSWQ